MVKLLVDKGADVNTRGHALGARGQRDTVDALSRELKNWIDYLVALLAYKEKKEIKRAFQIREMRGASPRIALERVETR